MNKISAKPTTITIENSLGLKKIPMYLDSKLGKLNTMDKIKDPTVKYFKNEISFIGNSSLRIKIEIEKIEN